MMLLENLVLLQNVAVACLQLYIFIILLHYFIIVSRYICVALMFIVN